MDIALSEIEVTCLKKLAEHFAKGEPSWSDAAGWETIGLTSENYRPVLSMLEQYGYITDSVHTTQGWFEMFRVSATAVQAVRAIEAEEKKKQEGRDIVESVKTTVRRHPFWGWVMIIGTVLAVVITIVNGIVSILKNLGAIP